jgi:hypothetical protein
VSVEFIRTKGANGPTHILVGGAFVNVPSNPDPRVVSAKTAFGSAVQAILDGKSYEDASDAMVQATHDASAHLGAESVVAEVQADDPSGEAEGTNKGAALRLRLKALAR